MTAQDHGGQAFPRDFGQNEGMALRDWFAGQALAGLIANPQNVDGQGGSYFAKVAYQAADAMIAARKGGAA